MSYDPISAIEVLCWGHKVGVLAPHPQRDVYVFEYYPEFLKSGIELAPITLPLSKSTPALFPFLSKETFHGLPSFIADSLPDSFGNILINTWMQRQGLRRNEISVLDRLAYMGSRAMGALEFRPAIERQQKKATILDLKGLVEEARKAFTLGPGFLDGNPDEAVLQLIQVGTSAGGAKAKAVVGYNSKTGSIVSGQFDLPKGFEHWLLKINTSEDETKDFGRIEYAYYLMARDCGITISESKLLSIGDRMHFMTKRFDREGNKGAKKHMQTLCAMAELDYNLIAAHDYIQLFQTIESLELGYNSIDEAFDRMVFNVCAANNDDHTKNHSFMLEENSSWKLAPAYDLMHANIPGNRWVEQHLMGINGVYREVSRKSLLEVGQRFSVSHPEDRIDRMCETILQWSKYAEQAGLNSEETNRVGRDIKKCCLLVKR